MTNGFIKIIINDDMVYQLKTKNELIQNFSFSLKIEEERLIFNLIMMLIWQSKWKSIWQKNHFLFWLLVILAFSINHLTVKTILI